MPSAPIISFDFRPSRRIRRGLGLIAVVAAICPWLSGAPGWIGDLLDGVVCWSVVVGRRRPVEPMPVVWLADTRWLLAAGRPDEVEWSLRRSWRLGPCLVVELQAPGRRCGLWLGPDNIPAATLRRLRARLALTRVEKAAHQHPLA